MKFKIIEEKSLYLQVICNKNISIRSLHNCNWPSQIYEIYDDFKSFERWFILGDIILEYFQLEHSTGCPTNLILFLPWIKCCLLKRYLLLHWVNVTQGTDSDLQCTTHYFIIIISLSSVFAIKFPNRSFNSKSWGSSY